MAMEAPKRQPQLTSKHRQDLIQGSGIPAEIVEREGLWSATAEQAKELLGWDVGSAGIVFPYPGHDDFVRIRLDKPYMGPGYKKGAKYLSPRKKGNRLYIPKSLPNEAVLGRDMLIITEGEKKALAAIGKGLPCIATAGIWSWKSRNEYGEKQDDERALLDDFGRINWSDRELVVLIYDSDITQEHAAWDAYPRLAEQLYRLGVVAVKILSLPHVAKGDKTGLDDYLLNRTPDDLRLLIADTPVWVPSEDGAEAFVSRRIEAACERLRVEGTPDAAYDEETLLALASAQMAAETEYARARERLAQAGRGVDKRALNRRVKELVNEIRGRQSAKRTAPPVSVEVEKLLPDAPIELRRPPGWHVSERGIYRYAKDEILMASLCPVLITRRLRRVDIGEERLELAYHRDGGWRTIIAQPSTVLTARNVVTLADRGLPVSSETARHLVTYLTDLLRENDDIIPRIEAVGHYGWVGNRAFLPGAAGDVVVDIDGAPGYEPGGEFDRWLRFASQARRHPMVRFALACGFAAPLLRLVGHRTFIVHLWGPSRGGKTAAGWLATSVWGDPEQLTASFYATRVGMERMAALYSDLPMLVDERQVVGDKQELVEGLVYMLGLGRSKIRGTKSGGLEAARTWNTIVLTTGEEPLSSDSSPTGVKTRALEWYGEPFEGDEREARQIYGAVKQHHGHAGPLFIRRLMAELERDPNMVKADVDIMTGFLEKEAPGALGSHLTAVAVVAAADAYASEWVFGEPEDQAFEGAVALAQTVLAHLETAAAADEANRALEWVRSWVSQHAAKLPPQCEAEPNERFGWTGHGTYGDAGWVYILPSAFRRCMKEGGFSERRVLRDFAERGWIETSAEGGKVNFKIRKRFGYDNVRVVALKPAQEVDQA